MFDIDLVHRNYVVRIVLGFSMDIKARRQTNRHIKGLIVKCSWSYKNEMQIIMTIYKANVKSLQKVFTHNDQEGYFKIRRDQLKTYGCSLH